jgi:hypothetical protein
MKVGLSVLEQTGGLIYLLAGGASSFFKSQEPKSGSTRTLLRSYAPTLLRSYAPTLLRSYAPTLLGSCAQVF